MNVLCIIGKRVKIGPKKENKKLQKIRTIQSLQDDENKEKETIEIYSVVEIYQHTSNINNRDNNDDINIINNNNNIITNTPPENLMSLPVVAIVGRIAQSLGLSVVGCCIGSSLYKGMIDMHVCMYLVI